MLASDLVYILELLICLTAVQISLPPPHAMHLVCLSPLLIHYTLRASAMVSLMCQLDWAIGAPRQLVKYLCLPRYFYKCVFGVSNIQLGRQHKKWMFSSNVGMPHLINQWSQIEQKADLSSRTLLMAFMLLNCDAGVVTLRVPRISKQGDPTSPS